MKKLVRHFDGKTTYFVGTLCINGCQTFTLEQAPAVFAEYQVPEHYQEDVLVNLPQADWNFEDDRDLKVALAKCTGTPSYVLAVLAKDENWHIRYQVACNRNAQPCVLSELTNDPVVEVRQEVACNPNAPVEILAILKNDEKWGVRRLAERHPNAPANKAAEEFATV